MFISNLAIANLSLVRLVLSEQNRKATGGGLVMCQCGGNIPDCQGVMIGNKVNCTCCGSCAEMQGGKELR